MLLTVFLTHGAAVSRPSDALLSIVCTSYLAPAMYQLIIFTVVCQFIPQRFHHTLPPLR